jgi:uncharacterized membrane protein YhhN
MLGDIGIEFNILIGLGLFLIAHLIFSVAFIWQSLLLGGTFSSLTGFILVLIANAIYLIFFLEYLQSSEEGLGRYKIPVVIYAIMIAFMLSSSVLLWLITGLITGIVVTLGAVFFVISDSLIGIREWHHPITKSTIKIEGTYYVAIFLLSLNVIIYLF